MHGNHLKYKKGRRANCRGKTMTMQQKSNRCRQDEMCVTIKTQQCTVELLHRAMHSAYYTLEIFSLFSSVQWQTQTHPSYNFLLQSTSPVWSWQSSGSVWTVDPATWIYLTNPLFPVTNISFFSALSYLQLFLKKGFIVVKLLWNPW